MVYIRTMIKLNIYEAKTHLSEYLAKLTEGDTIVLCRHNTPIAEIRLLPSRPTTPRPIGLAKAVFHVPHSFFEPLPAEMLAAFEGRDA